MTTPPTDQGAEKTKEQMAFEYVRSKGWFASEEDFLAGRASRDPEIAALKAEIERLRSFCNEWIGKEEEFQKEKSK